VRAATWAPSGANRQAFTFVVVTERDQIARIAGLWERAAGFYCNVLAPNTCGSQDLKARAAMEHQRQHFADVPAVIFACYRPSRFGSRLVGNMRALRRVPGTLGVLAALRLLFRLRRWSDHAAAASVYPAVENLLLAARARGLGATLTTWHFALEPSFAAVLGLPRGQRIYAAIPVGYPVGRFGPVARKPVSEALRWERWAPDAEPGR
jgi:nitroreductase